MLFELTFSSGANVQNSRFLWVSFQLRDICDTISDANIRETLENLPDGFTETYYRIITKINRSSRRAHVAFKIFQWIACAQRPLKVNELQEAVAFEPYDTSWDADKIPNQDDMMQSCRSLVVRDAYTGTVRFAYHTVQQYLLSSQATALMHSNSPSLLSMSQACNTVGHMCMVYLLFSDFETQITFRKSREDIQNAGASLASGASRIPRLLEIGNMVYSVINRIHGSPQPLSSPEIDWTKYFAHKPKQNDKVSTDFTSRYWSLAFDGTAC